MIDRRSMPVHESIKVKLFMGNGRFDYCDMTIVFVVRFEYDGSQLGRFRTSNTRVDEKILTMIF